MSYSSIMYALDIDQFIQSVNSHDQGLLEKARAQFEDDWDDGDAPTLGEAIEDIMLGRDMNPEALRSGQYFYGLQCLVSVAAEALPDDDMIGALTDLEIDSPLEIRKSPVKILYDENDIPMVSFLSKEEVRIEANRLQSFEFSEVDNELENARDAYIECIDTAASQDKGIICFYH